ncbi:MAG TPA: ATP-binding protein [Steroidobacteraceae bacterium]|nr:ATP-binding protein [Steroidobacteraceae bacterium]
MTESALAVERDCAPISASALLLETQKRVLEMMVQNRPLAEVLSALCLVAEELAPRPARAAILLVDHDGRHLITGAAPSLPASYSRAVDGIAISPSVGTCAAAAARREIVVTADIATDPAWQAYAQLPLELGLRAAWSMPILSATGVVLGTFGTYFPHKREPSTEEVSLVEVLARTAALAIERQRADEALQASEARHRAMVEASPECVKLVAPDGTLLQINAAGLHMIEADDASAVTGRSVYGLIAPEQRARYREFHERVCRGEAGRHSFDIVGLRGGRRSMECSAVPLAMPGGMCCQLSITRDVTQRLAGERALAESHARLQLAVLLSGIGFWHCDLPFGELVWDARVKEHFFFGHDARITIDDFYARLHAEDREPTRLAIETAIREHRPYDVIYRTVDPVSGAHKWIRALGGAVYGDGRATQFDGVTVDVTEQRQAQQRLAELNAELTEHDRRRNEFLATLAHELRNPLAPVRTGLHLLQRGGAEEQLARVRAMMERQLGHLVHMVDDLLDVSRITLGKVTLKKETVDLRSVVDSALEATRPLLEAAGHTLVTRLGNDSLPLAADFTRLTQVVVNLVSNAVRYTPPGGRIEISARTHEDRIELQVSDTGIGIPADMLPRVFDPFTQAHPAIESSQSGLGLGLTLARRLVAIHGGTLTAASDGIGTGSRFTVSLPAAAGTAATPGSVRAAPPAVAQPLRVLIVDDNADAAETVAMLLGLAGHAPRVAHSGEAALGCAEEFQPEVVLLDLGLPGLSGHEVARRLRRTARGPLRLVALTGWGSDEDRRQAQAAGFDHHLVKPVAAELLLAAII